MPFGKIDMGISTTILQVKLLEIEKSRSHISNDLKVVHMDSMYVTVTMTLRDVLNLKSLRDVTVMQIFQYP